MPKVIADITMSLDGYVTGPGATLNTGSEMPPSSTRRSASRTRSTPRSSKEQQRPVARS
jgi:hypothetical protein